MADTRKPLILVATSKENLRRRWGRALRPRFAITEVGHRPSLVKSMLELKPAVLLLDLALPRLGGFRATPLFSTWASQTAIIILTRSADEREGLSSLTAGARGYCSEDIAPRLLRKAVEKILEGEIWASRKIVSRSIDELASITASRRKASRAKPYGHLADLSARQRQIAELVSLGANNKEIANRLDVKEKTVKAYLTAVFRKLGLSSRLQLALFVTAHARTVRPGSRIASM